MTDLNHGILGIDISKAKFDVALLVAGKVKKTHIFENAPDGFKALSSWLMKQGISSVSACMEATGCYGDALATWLYDQGFMVSVVNPAQIKSFGGAQLNRAKTDKADAKLIAQFYQQMSPAPGHLRRCTCASCRRWCNACLRSCRWSGRSTTGWTRHLPLSDILLRR